MMTNSRHAAEGPAAHRPTVLVVEDEAPMREMIAFGLEKEGLSVVPAASGEEALACVRAGLPDLVLLDLMLPGIDGFAVCRSLKGAKATAGIPIVMLTARHAEADVIAGLELGADDYLTKPFSPRVLAARLKAMLRRHAGAADNARRTALRAGELSVDRERREALVAGARVDLTYTEFEILWLLASSPGTVFTRSRIVDAVRGSDATITERAVDVRLVGLRRKLGAAGTRIETVRGVGYRFGD
jgi:two-component system phosphate regulon response regulator PhoB